MTLTGASFFGRPRFSFTATSILGRRQSPKFLTIVPKRKYLSEDDPDDDDYSNAECPECGATITARFQRGRTQRRVQCPICHKQVTIFLERESAPLVQLQHEGSE